MKEPPNLEYEKKLWDEGIDLVAGIDEAGRGSLAGPVAGAVIILPKMFFLGEHLFGVRDSKQMTPGQRSYWAERLKKIALHWQVSYATHDEIDEQGIVPATKLSILRAFEHLEQPPQHLLIDYIKLESCPLPQTSIVKGDQISTSIAAASILAKTSRDEIMCDYDAQFPGYGFARNKGYATAAHRSALAEMGFCPIHRKSFRVKLSGNHNIV